MTSQIGDVALLLMIFLILLILLRSYQVLNLASHVHTHVIPQPARLGTKHGAFRNKHAHHGCTLSNSNNIHFTTDLKKVQPINERPEWLDVPVICTKYKVSNANLASSGTGIVEPSFEDVNEFSGAPFQALPETKRVPVTVPSDYANDVMVYGEVDFATHLPPINGMNCQRPRGVGAPSSEKLIKLLK